MHGKGAQLLLGVIYPTNRDSNGKGKMDESGKSRRNLMVAAATFSLIGVSGAANMKVFGVDVLLSGHRGLLFWTIGVVALGYLMARFWVSKDNRDARSNARSLALKLQDQIVQRRVDQNRNVFDNGRLYELQEDDWQAELISIRYQWSSHRHASEGHLADFFAKDCLNPRHHYYVKLLSENLMAPSPPWEPAVPSPDVDYTPRKFQVSLNRFASYSLRLEALIHHPEIKWNLLELVTPIILGATAMAICLGRIMLILIT